MKALKFLIPAVVALAAMPAVAADPSVEAAIGGAVGGGVGAYLGNEVGGSTGAVVGGAVGAATGAAIATDGNNNYRPRYPAPAYQAPPPPPAPYYYDRAYPYRSPGTFCPPGQAKKGRCY